MNIDFIRGILQTLNKLHWKVNKDSIPLTGYGCEILTFNNIKGQIYFDTKRQEYYYTEKPEVSTTSNG